MKILFRVLDDGHRRRRLLAVLATTAACLLAGAPAASAALEIETFDGEVIANAGGAPATQAGSHPYEASQEIDFTAHEEGGFKIPDGAFKDVEVKLPAGFTGNPNAVPKCPLSTFLEGALVFTPPCPKNTAIGTTELKGNAFVLPFKTLVFNLQHGPNEPALFGFRALTAAVLLHASIRTGSDYGTTITIPNSVQALPVTGTALTFWGVPGDPSHDEERGGPFEGTVRPFLSNPTSCSGPLTTTLRVNSWEEPNNFLEASFLGHDSSDNLVGIEGCDKLLFEPELEVHSQPSGADSPTALSVHLRIPQHNEDPEGLITAHLKTSVVTLPPGLTINPAAATGLGGCSEAEFGLDNPNPVTCPSFSRIGTGEIVSPLLATPLTGSIFMAQPGLNPFHSLLAIYMITETEGVKIKLAGHIEANPVTGQLTTTFDNNPRLPFSDFRLDFFGGPRGALVNPSSCGVHSVLGSFTPWSATPAVASNTMFTIDSGPGGGSCPTDALVPRFHAGSTNPAGGRYSPFVVNVGREDGTQRLGGIDVTLPEGVLDKIAGVPYCPEAAVAAAEARSGEGQAGVELASPSCPAASLVGSLAATAGAGSDPFYLGTGRVYLAGPYKGAPLSLVIVVPAVAGPFDLGNVVVRAALFIDPETSQLRVVSDPLPTILHGIPLDLREVRVNVDRPGFSLNPTSCNPMSVDGSIAGTGGAVAPVSDRFQVGSCAGLGFTPKLNTRLFGPTAVHGHPKFRSTLITNSGDANISSAAVTLPHSEFLDQSHIKTVCTRVQFAAGQCPKASIYGSAVAKTPLLDNPLRGPVYLRSSSHELPDLVAALRGQIEIDLVGRIDSVHGGMRTVFQAVPDAPVSKFVLTLQGGKKGLLVNSRNLCNRPSHVVAKLSGQNGKFQSTTPLLKNSCGKKP